MGISNIVLKVLLSLGILHSVVFSQEQDDRLNSRLDYLQKNKKQLPHDSSVVLSKLFIQTGKTKEAKQIHDSCFIQKKASNEDLKISAAASLWEAIKNSNIALFSTIPGKRLKEAKEYLDDAWKTDSLDAEIMFLFGKYFELKKNYEESAVWYKRAVHQDERCYTYGFRTGWLELANVYEKLGKIAEAAEGEETGTLLTTTDDDTWPMITMAFKLLKLGKEDRFSESFNAGLYNIKDSILVDSLYHDCGIIAADEEKAEWDTLKTKSERLEFLKRFWKSRDLDLTTSTNERMVEHYKRLFHARSMYYFQKKPWLDDRGKVYVRYGKPDKIHSGSSQGTVDVDEGFKSSSNRGNDIIAGMNIYDNESWIYQSPDFHFDFVNIMGCFELKPLIRAVGIGSAPSEINQGIKFQAMISVYNERIRHDAVYGRLKSHLEKGNIQEIIVDYEKSLDNSKKQSFKPIFSRPHLPLTFSFSSFRDKNQLTAVDFYYIIPFAELSFNIQQSNLKKQTSLLTVWLSVYDHQYNEVLKKKYEMNLLKDMSFDQSNYFLDVRRIQLKPGTYHVGFRALSDTSKEGVYKAKIVVPDYSTDKLQMSDVQTAFKIDDGMTADKYTKPGTLIRVLPNPGKMNNKSKPLYVYYEIYNLTLDADGKSRYQIEYKMLPDKSQETFVNTLTNIFTKQSGSIGSITTKEGLSTVSREYMAFDVSEVPEGASVLEITVTDMNTQRQCKKTTPLILKIEK